MKVPLLDLRPQWAALRDEIVPALERVFEHQQFVNGPEIEALEKVVARGLHVVEDAAQAIGASQRGRRAGSLGAAGCLSFFPSKNLGGLGDGGMLTVASAELAERARQCRNHGSRQRYYHRFVGGNFRLDTLQAAALLMKMRHLDEWHAARRAHAARYDDLLAGVAEVVRPVVRPGNESVVNQYLIRVRRRDECKAFLRERGIGCEVYYPLCLHEQECFASLGHRRGDFPAAERAAAESLALPVYPELTDEQLRHVAEGVKDFLAGHAG
jgi:dTDP-4-amino-4,6-dideoxygalactose transaminase